MSLRTTVQRAVKTGLKAMDDIQETATYGGVTTTAYDPATGTITETSGGGGVVKMVFTSFSFMEIDGVAVLANDRKVIIASLDLDVTPTLNDTITRADGSAWNVIGIKTDPAGAAWVLQIRKP